MKLTIPNPQLYEIWENIVTEIVKARVSNVVPIELKLDIFSNAELRSETPNVLRNIFLIQAAEALDNLVFKSKVWKACLLIVIIAMSYTFCFSPNLTI